MKKITDKIKILRDKAREKYTDLKSRSFKNSYVRAKAVCVSVIVIAAVSFASPSQALFGLTIEELMERFGIVRLDRLDDIKDVVLLANEIQNIIPKDFFSPNLDSILGDTSLSSLVDTYKKYENIKEDAENMYQGFTNGFGIIDKIKGMNDSGLLAAFTAEGDMWNADIDWKKYKKAPAEKDPFHQTEITKAIEDARKEKWSGQPKKTMAEVPDEILPGASVTAALGVVETEGGLMAIDAKANIENYIEEVKTKRLTKVIEILGENEAVRAKIMKEFAKTQEGLAEDISSVTSNALSANDDMGTVLKTTSANYAAVSQAKMLQSSLMGALQEMYRYRLRIRAQEAYLSMFDYSEYTMNMLTQEKIRVSE